jgi:hypothetical protein
MAAIGFVLVAGFQAALTERVVEAAAPDEATFPEIGEVDLKGFLGPVKVSRRG